jgi:hypothetical protein
MGSLLNENIAIITTRQETSGSWSHSFVAKVPVDMCALSLASKECCHVFPIYRYIIKKGEVFSLVQSNGNVIMEKVSNLNKSVSKTIHSKLRMEYLQNGTGDLKNSFGPEDIMHYLYSILYSSKFRMPYRKMIS